MRAVMKKQSWALTANIVCGSGRRIDVMPVTPMFTQRHYSNLCSFLTMTRILIFAGNDEGLPEPPPGSSISMDDSDDDEVVKNVKMVVLDGIVMGPTVNLPNSVDINLIFIIALCN